MRPRRVPLRRSLVVRLLATSVLVAVTAIVATAWLAVQSTTRAIQQEQGRSLADDKSVYDAMLRYAATHRDWSGVGPVLQERARELGRRITLMTEDRQTIAESGPGASLLAARPSATVDPLRVDLRLTGGTERIDRRVVGPYLLSAAERASLRRNAERELTCLQGDGFTGEIVEGPGGRPVVRVATSSPSSLAARCASEPTTRPVPAEDKALRALAGLVARCLDISPDLVSVQPGFVVKAAPAGREPDSQEAWDNEVRACTEQARQQQLRPFAAPPALLFVTDPAVVAPQPVFNLSRANAVRIAAVTGAVLLLTVMVTVLVGVRLVRPLWALTDAARQPLERQARAPVTTRDEIGYLATALNDLAERRERTEQQRKALVSDVAHELRTPVTNMRVWLEAAQDGLAAVDPQLLALLLEEAVLLQHIIDDLRDLAEADAGELRVHPEPSYVKDTMEQVADAHLGSAEAAGVHLRTECDADPQVFVDPVRLRQLVGNLVSNAVRHTPEGGTVTIRSGMAGGRLAIQVIDTGVGIAADDLPRVFDRFWRADTSRNRSTGGSGLGLAIARQLAEAHHGVISVTSRLGAGTIFSVEIPADSVEIPADPVDVPAAPSRT